MSGNKWGDFLKDKSGRGGFNRLRNWREDGEIVIWIHTNTRIHKRLFHMIPFVKEQKDEQTGNTHDSIMFLPFVCHETVYDYMNRNNAKRCPLCRFIDHLRSDGNIPDHEKVWDSSIGDRKRDRICTKADFTGDSDGGGDWRLSFKPSLQYVIATIDNDNPSEGISIATEKFSLGESIKKAVRMEIDRRGPEEGDPDQNPYAFKWIFNKQARQSSEYYTAYPFERAELTDEIAELLQKPEEDLSSWISPGDTKKLRDAMEAHVTVDDVDFDMLFDNVLENTSTNADSEEPAEEKVEQSKQTSVKPEPEPDSKSEPPADDEVPTMECPSCRGKGEKRGKDCKVCDGTGKVEAPEDDNENEATPEPEKPKKKAPPKKTRKAATPPPKPEPEDNSEKKEEMAECGRCGKDVLESATMCPYCNANFK